jgi:uncharacterized protein with LGFP repeats
LPGAIGTKWQQLGGAAWGTPTSSPQPLANGGRYVQFQHRDGSLSVIFSSSATGTWVVGSRMNSAFARVGWANGTLGLPTSDERVTHDGVGRFQTFQRGLVVWHPTIGAFEVHGAISAQYLALGGTRFGYPTTDESGTPDRRGRFNHFRDVSNNAVKSIYWTPTTGAQPVYGLIRNHWSAIGWERSPLGYPTSAEADTHDRRGRYQLFEGGSMVWAPETGAHAVYGEVLARYGALGGSAYGYPTNDPTKTPDGIGRFQHYRDLGQRTDRSIYWSPATGAHEVFGLIRERWSQLGWERSHLGYPTSGEQPWTGRDRNGKRQSFQGGTMFYSGPTGAYADPMRWSKHFKSGGFHGDLTVIVDSSGRVRLQGRAAAGAPARFSYVVQSMVTSNIGEAIVLSHKGTLTAVTQEDGDALNDNFVDARVRDHFSEFSRGSLRVDHQHSNDVTKFIGDITDGLIKWTVGSIAITPGTGLILLGAAELYSALSGGGVAAGARIASGMMWMAGPSGMVFALAADGLARLATDEDTLDEDAYRVADAVFKGTLPPRDRIVVSNAIGAGGKPFTFPRWDGKIVLNLGDGAADPLTATHGRCTTEGQLLVHELTHAWHYHHDPALLRYVTSAVFGAGAHPGTNPTSAWTSYSQEQQAVIVDEWFARHYDRNAPDSGLGSPGATGDVAFRYIRDQIRRARTS